MTTTYTISTLAAEFDMTTRAIRFYEDQGLLAPTRNGRTRIFSPRDRTRLRLIQRGKRLGFSLQEIGEMLDMYDDARLGESHQLSYFLERIGERRKALTQQVRDIEDTLTDLNVIERQCQERLNGLQNAQQSMAERIEAAASHRLVQDQI